MAGVGPLLRAVDGRGPARAAERVVDVAGDRRPRRPRASGRGRRHRSGRGEPGRRRRVPGRGPTRRAGDSRAPGPAPRRRRWSRCRRCRRSRAAPRPRSPPAAARPSLASWSARGRVGRPGTSTSPEAAAISMTAVRPSPSIPNRARTGSPSGPLTTASRNAPPVAATRASTVPSPPSAIGARSISASGRDRDHAARQRAGRLGGRQAPLELVRGQHHPHPRVRL